MSSGEAEFYAGVSGMSRAIGLRQMMADWGIQLKLVIGTDSSAGLALTTRFGLGRAKHINTQYLWAQDAVARGEARMEKIGTDLNSADLFTKNLSEARIIHLMGLMGFIYPESGCGKA